jgi:hypothetical protein
MGLPACWTSSPPERRTPIEVPPDRDTQEVAKRDDNQNVGDGDMKWQANPAKGYIQGCTPETVCGRSNMKHGPMGCGPHGDSLESYGGNYQNMSVTRMSWSGNAGELRLFDIDAAQTAQYQRTLTVAQAVDRYCCYSHCTPSRPASQLPVAPPGLQLVTNCNPSPLPAPRPAHADNAACPASAGANIYVGGTDAQCCYGTFEPIPPPQVRHHNRGRAARIDGQAVTASVRDGSTWTRDLRPHLDGISEATRCELRDAWKLAAQMEHASIAAFSALSLRLLALGAPAELIARTHAAALDEVRHAQIAFALASAYAAAPLEPARFTDVARLPTTSTLAELAYETFVDGCIEETAAAVDASLGASAAHDPIIADALQSIAADEAEHAELAWAIVAWCVRADPTIADRLRALLVDQLASAASATTGNRELARHGIRSSADSAATKARVLRDVVEPCLAALIASAC